MKTTITLLFAIISCIAFGQEPPTGPIGGKPIFERAQGPCISEDHRAAFNAQIEKNIQILREAGRFLEPKEQGNHPLFIWPVEQASGFDYHNIWGVTNYVDHNEAFPDAIQDFECGTRSYDTTSGYNHQGYDIISWPFWWKQMDLDQAINVAAADGQIVGKQDGNFDRNCSFNTNPLNGIAIQHSDGSRSLYFHFKDGGITSKEIGDTVVAGEYLGVIGSSGSSTAPHLHFEVFDSSDNLIDPTVGLCNDLNDDTWWVDPISYYNPGINAVLTHTDFPEFNPCPETETTNESDQFDLNDDIVVAVYLRDQRPNTSLQLRTIRPDGSVQFDWDFDLADDLSISWWVWTIPGDMEGIWTWEATYLDETVTHNFNVGVLGIEDLVLETLKLYPNPTNDGIITLEFADILEDKTITVTNVLGQTISSKHYSNQESVDLKIGSDSGLYFITVSTTNGTTKTYKIIKR